ncbi:arrestin C-terminal domain-containing protein [Aspergillus saccharolyticus JOP 1030-1]|uniref:Arrestin domain protein n=1 Tax=Aspergillus saccharolyticus JOP 1030-1 TaxID=1450539 RepID=A0A318Z7C5_9EURO|nr:arrestin domain protein [Aspergillus saccharolyticus JOP 1030-1]PYH42324.1 arrestin domain protein [Aspergillus saccharolyticus JOP 1030-1]
MSKPAFVRVSGPPNGNFLIGYPGISATMPRIEGKVEIRPSTGISLPVSVSLVTISLHRRETIHPSADSVTKKHLAPPRKEITDIVGKEMLLFRCPAGRESEEVISMDLPFVLFIPFGRGGADASRRVPPASLQLPSRTAETYYEIVVAVQQGPSEQRKYTFPVPIQRYDTLSTFGMYNRPESAERVSDHLVTLGISLPRWSYGPLDPVSVYVKLSPNPDWISKARKVTINKITIGIDEEIIYNHEGDEPQRKVKTLTKRTEPIGVKLPPSGFLTNLGLVFPAKDMRDSEGILPRSKPGFPTYAVSGFTTTGSLYKIEYYLTVKAHLASARDITIRQPIVVCPLDHAGCKEEMEAIEQAARDAVHVNPDNPMLPLPSIVRPNDPNALRHLGVAIVGGKHKPLID